MRWRAAALALLTACAVLGCGDSNEPKRNKVSGKVTYDGQPIVFGDVVITPDGAKKNSGAQGFANIRDGVYDTSASGGKGYGGGPAIIRVTGFDKQGGKLLCEQEFQVDLPTGDATHDIAVPAKGKAKETTPEI
jgi:hypothetical protein